MTEPREEQANAETKRKELAGKVLAVNDLVQYQEGTVASRMIVFKKTGTITLFAFDAILTVTDGVADITIAGAPFTVKAGEMIILPANIPHGVQARQRFRMTLTMIRE